MTMMDIRDMMYRDECDLCRESIQEDGGFYCQSSHPKTDYKGRCTGFRVDPAEVEAWIAELQAILDAEKEQGGGIM